MEDSLLYLHPFTRCCRAPAKQNLLSCSGVQDCVLRFILTCACLVTIVTPLVGTLEDAEPFWMDGIDGTMSWRYTTLADTSGKL
jgi:hypothetical protein